VNGASSMLGEDVFVVEQEHVASSPMALRRPVDVMDGRLIGRHDDDFADVHVGRSHRTEHGDVGHVLRLQRAGVGVRLSGALRVTSERPRWNSVWTMPGDTEQTRTPVPIRSIFSPSFRARTANLDAQYTAPFG